MAGLGWAYWVGLGLAAAHFAWQVITLRLDDSADCLTKFRANRDTGLILFAAFLLG
jgi:4-hydroxybenzoate polyprenyltransferase